MSTDDVLQRIDAVLDEPVDDSWTRGPDAMRWTAEDPGRWLTVPLTRALGSVRLVGGPSGGPARITDGDRVLMAWDGSASGDVATFIVQDETAPWDRPDADPLADVAALLERAAAAPPVVFDVEAFQRAAQQIGEVGAIAVRIVNDCFRRLGEGLSAASSQGAYTLMPPPLDALSPRERALEARRRRGTGPAARRLDGRRR